MRISYSLSPLISIFLSFSCLTSTYSTQSTTNSSVGPVLDIAGHHLQANTNYYIFPAQTGGNSGGGLSLSSHRQICPLYVIQLDLEISKGFPLRFFTADNKQNSISLSTDINIGIDDVDICMQSPVWTLSGVDLKTGQRYVKTGGLMGHPGIETWNNWFKIEKNLSGNGYKFVFCPSVCKHCNVVCGNIGVFDENRTRWLVLSDEPLAVMFKKA